MTCIICLFPIDDTKYTCSNPKCKEPFCQECLVMLIQYSLEESLLPACPSRNCQHTLLSCNLYKLPKEVIVMYEKCCFQFFLKSDGDVVNNQLNERKVLEQLREERQRFIIQTYPEAISLIATIAFSSKLTKLEKQKQKLLKDQALLNKRKCMNSVCNGYLNDDLVCMLCENQFCKQCERKILQNNNNNNKEHQCKQEDLDSVSIINDMVRCPGCKLPVFKNVGCNHITCSNCSTNFEYTTGALSSAGSNNSKLTVDLDQIKPLSFTHKDKLSSNVLQLLVEVESLQPKPLSKDIILLPLRDYYNNKDAHLCANRLVKALERYTLNQMKVKEFMNKLIVFEELLNSNKSDDTLRKKLLKIKNIK